MQEQGQPAPRNTYVIDAEQAAELARLMQQERLATEAMGGLLPEINELPPGARVLDLACGPGGWALELAYAYPQVEVIGVDISPSVVEYANAQAWSRGLSNVHFQVMNVMDPLAFPDASYDLINGRLLGGFMLPTAWPALLSECRRLLKPGGFIRLTETEGTLSNSAGLEYYWGHICKALTLAGQSFSPDGRHVGITAVLPGLVRDAGFQDVRLRASVMEWSSGTPAHYGVFKDTMLALELVRPFLLKMGVAPQEELERLAQQAVGEMQQANFRALSYLLTVWGQQPH